MAIVAFGAMVIFLTAKPIYTSRTVLPLSPWLEALVTTDVILNPVVKDTHFADLATSTQQARRLLAAVLKVSPELKSGTGLHSIEVSDTTPERAKNVLDRLLSEVYSVSRPVGGARTQLLADLNNTQEALSNLEALAKTLNDKSETVKGGTEGEQYGRAMVALVNDIAAKKMKIWQLHRSLEGLLPEDVVLQPTLPSASNPLHLVQKLLLVIITGLLAVFGGATMMARLGGVSDNQNTMRQAA